MKVSVATAFLVWTISLFFGGAASAADCLHGAPNGQYIVRSKAPLRNTLATKTEIIFSPLNFVTVSSASNLPPYTFLLKNLDAQRIKNMRADGSILSVEPDCYYVPDALELSTRILPPDVATAGPLATDPLLDRLWGMVKIGADLAWKFYRGSTEIIVSINDSGIDFSHEDLRENLWTNLAEIPGNGIDDDGNGCIDDIHGCNNYEGTGDTQPGARSYGHGTHVAGTVAAILENSIGVAGVAPEVRVMDSQAFPSSGGIGANTRSTMIKSIYYSIRNRAHVINCSWSSQSNPSQAEKDAFQLAYDSGITVIVAAGNEGHDVEGYMPMGFPTVIPVAATNRDDGLADFSNFGNTVFLAAPGGRGVDDLGKKRDGIWSTYPMARGAYAEDIGTSMAAPHVAGLAALILSIKPDLPPEKVKNYLFRGTDPIRVTPPHHPDLHFDYGRIHVKKTLDLVLQDYPLPPSPYPGTPSPKVTIAPSGFPSPCFGEICKNEELPSSNRAHAKMGAGCRFSNYARHPNAIENFSFASRVSLLGIFAIPLSLLFWFRRRK